jgi:hypothetical protein
MEVSYSLGLTAQACSIQKASQTPTFHKNTKQETQNIHTLLSNLELYHFSQIAIRVNSHTGFSNYNTSNMLVKVSKRELIQGSSSVLK